MCENIPLSIDLCKKLSPNNIIMSKCMHRHCQVVVKFIKKEVC